MSHLKKVGKAIAQQLSTPPQSLRPRFQVPYIIRQNFTSLDNNAVETKVDLNGNKGTKKEEDCTSNQEIVTQIKRPSELPYMQWENSRGKPISVLFIQKH